MSPNRIAEFVKPFLVLISVLFVLVFFYGVLTGEDDDNDFTVTVVYDCNTVLANKNDYSNSLVDTCERLRISSL